MSARTLVFFFILLFPCLLKAQETNVLKTWEEYLRDENLPELSERDIERLARVPDLKLPALYKSPAAPLLPQMVDNSTQPFMRPVFHQVALECGQASGVGYDFTYEMNYKRNAPGNVATNQYPTHFVWNFSNNGASCGVGFMESWDIIKGAGTVNVQDYGGMSTLGANGWVTGYQLYYNAMLNRASDFYAIDVSTEEGILTLKHWIHDHLEGSTAGGVATFGGYALVGNTLAPGTPEAGFCVTVNWTTSTNHQLCIVGYHDSIRYDFNNDGLYTNDIDINGDGIVDVRDWEIGGVKWVNSFGTGTGTGGYCYTMYKNLADPKSQGGIWNNRVYVVIPKADYQPRLTYKVTVKHDCRSKLKVMAGISMDTTANVPEYVMEFPVFHYQGGEYFMQGGTTSEANKTLEFGLDVTPLLSATIPAEKARFFLMINENDLYDQGTGILQAFSVMDYTSGLVETPCAGMPVPLTEHGLTKVFLNKTVNFPQISINDMSLPDAALYQPYSHQMSASGGTPPYEWRLVQDYTENTFAETYSASGTQQLYPSNNSDGIAGKELDFPFPFYGTPYHKVYVHVDGYLMFDGQMLPWPFIVDERIYQRNTRNISPFLGKAQVITTGDGDGIWYSGCQDSATIRWKTSISGMSSSTDMNYSVTLYPDGKISFRYGNMLFPDYLIWVAGIASGDLFNYKVASYSGQLIVNQNLAADFTPDVFPLGLELSKSGLLSGTMMEPYYFNPIKFSVSDKFDFRQTKVLSFTTRGVEIIPVITSGGDSIIQYGETTQIGVHIKNIGLQTIVAPEFLLIATDPFINLIDSTLILPDLGPGDSVFVPSAYQFDVSLSVPDAHPLDMKIFTVDNNDTLGRRFTLTAFAPKLAISSILVMDAGNGSLDPGETANVLITLSNLGGASATGLTGSFSTTDPFLTINAGIVNIPSLPAYGSGTLVMNVTAAANAPEQYLVPVQLVMNGNNLVSLNTTFYLLIGYQAENFETGDFSLYNWNMAGNQPWFICDSLPYEGQHCAQSGNISDNQESILFVALQIQSPGNVGFFRRVSCEPDANNHNYDYLAFYIDGNEKQRWDGFLNWAETFYSVGTGYHTFKWNYHKDYSVSSGQDAAWIDQVSFPPFGDIITFNQEEIKQLADDFVPAPNPFRHGTSFFFSLGKPESLTLRIFDIQGRMVATLLDHVPFPAGLHHTDWKAEGPQGDAIEPGIYIYVFSTTDRHISGKLVKYE
ncbi:MAG TPA: T9SS type A sorting domain-containing protein [Bacteroidales bacterium]|nr:T9SS type A sorting domain-containing protein [Bacteroidales bacterium]HSA42796.1 T9SS type A sorting domain-containing protein [Bacteroidales bacterium]